jgi:lysosomal alpha-glucosidase
MVKYVSSLTWIKGVLGGSLEQKTICPSAKQHLSSHYNLHNMYGHYEAIATYK